MKHVKLSLLFGSGFAGGLLAGWFLLTYKNSVVFRDPKGRVETAIARINRVFNEGTVRLREINDMLKKEFTHPIPNLYRATESLSFDEEELMYD